MIDRIRTWLRGPRRLRLRPMAGERPTDPRLFQEWGQIIGMTRESSLDPDTVDQVRRAIDGLPARQRDVINGMFYEHPRGGQSELARRLGVSRHEVRRLMLAALDALKEKLR